ncbi:MAG: FliI/YscN family ATPase [Limnochordia bacterium]|jgi:flagellum-specific ATP synthase|nr:FliI/YscN family ATPase [Limnochordia bacterium]MDD2629379.1 FliI/YscN family ATPase [Limnochordia bacterium]MDD4518997.1 FliI/YscN family ATPase [Limnochordia bacterium]
MDLLGKYRPIIKQTDPILRLGKVTRVVGICAESLGPDVQVGEYCQIETFDGQGTIGAEVIGFRDGRILLMPLDDMDGIKQGSLVIATGWPLRIRVGPDLLGRVIDGLGRPIDGKGPLVGPWQTINAASPDPLSREVIDEPLSMGIRAIDATLTVGKGQRIGIFSGSGVGKSTLVGMIARNCAADVKVIALVGERGREVREFLENQLGSCQETSVVVAATSDAPPLIRLKAGFTATTIAEYFRTQGADVLLIMDSVTRLAMAQREIGLSAGEPPTTRGYTPSMFSLLPKLMERAGKAEQGSITGIYTVLVEGDDFNEPVSDTARGILDGHIVLSRRLAEQGHFPAIDVLASISRLMPKLVTPEQLHDSRKLIKLLAAYREVEDLLQVGAYRKGNNSDTDLAVKMHDAINEFLQQDQNEAVSFERSIEELRDLLAGI